MPDAPSSLRFINLPIGFGNCSPRSPFSPEATFATMVLRRTSRTSSTARASRCLQRLTAPTGSSRTSTTISTVKGEAERASNYVTMRSSLVLHSTAADKLLLAHRSGIHGEDPLPVKVWSKRFQEWKAGRGESLIRSEATAATIRQQKRHTKYPQLMSLLCNILAQLTLSSQLRQSLPLTISIRTNSYRERRNLSPCVYYSNVTFCPSFSTPESSGFAL